MSNQWDVAVVGGGILGAGVAQAAAAAGYSVALFEKSHLAAGTSSRSSKLIHGGLRYLQSAQWSLVRESLHERELLLRLAPDLVRSNWFYIPIYKGGHYPPWQMRTGLSLYALLTGFHVNARFESIPRRQWSELDGLTTDQLRHVFRYHDAQTDDALLTAAVAWSAQQLGAELYCSTELVKAEKTAEGYHLQLRGDQESEGSCRFLVNAAGPWINLVRDQVDPLPPKLAVDLVQGSHLVLDKPVSEHCFYLETLHDNRAVFVLPWQGGALLGTTEVPFNGPPEQVQPSELEEQYLMEIFRHYFPDYQGQVIDRFAGLRVLPKASGRLFLRSREMSLVADDDLSPHYLAIYGGKLTGYRASGEKVVKFIANQLGARTAQAQTDELPLSVPPDSFLS
ncbi:MAG: FAD-dependent oxidoreductase [Desulfuromonas sp.]|nr:FAD-dependent oxidoreductase [Desulfuromonas sp.]